VTLLEAKEHIGGRILSVDSTAGADSIELGAEFLHGKLPLTTALLSQAKISLVESGGEMFHENNQRRVEWDQLTKQWGELMRDMGRIKNDIPFRVFLDQYVAGGNHSSLYRSARGFAEGFDLADIRKTSTMAIRDEWQHEEDQQFRVKGGYGRLIHYLDKSSSRKYFTLVTDAPVKSVAWRKGEVKVFTSKDQAFFGNKLIVAIPPKPYSKILFKPAISVYRNAALSLGFGHALKIMLEFQRPFWQKTHPHAGFVFGNGDIPVWWTQLPSKTPLLTGWLGGPRSQKIKNRSIDGVTAVAIRSIAQIFNIRENSLRASLREIYFHDWSLDEFSMGSYSYPIVNVQSALKVLTEPVEKTIFFCGEHIYAGHWPGTVEAALNSGKAVAEKIKLRSV